MYTGKQVEGVLVPSEREGKVVCLDGFGDPRDKDPISRLGLNIRHTVSYYHVT